MLPPATLRAADHLTDIMVSLVESVAEPAINRGTPTLPQHIAQILALRLVALVRALIQIAAFGLPPRRTTTSRTPAAPTTRRPPSGPALSLPRRPGWLLAALPDIAPAFAASLAPLLSDPALAPILAAPTLRRALLPLLRSLGLAHPTPPEAPLPEPPITPAPPAPRRAPPLAHPVPRARRPATSRPKTARAPTPTHAHIVPLQKRLGH